MKNNDRNRRRGQDETAHGDCRNILRFLAAEQAEKEFCTWSVTLTRMNWYDAIPGGNAATPATVAGKSTKTSLPGERFLPSYPFKAAYWQGATPEVPAQSKLVPATNPP